MPDNHRGSPEQNHRLHSTCFVEKRFFKWEQDERSVNLRAAGGSYGGGSEVFVVTALSRDRAVMQEVSDTKRRDRQP